MRHSWNVFFYSTAKNRRPRWHSHSVAKVLAKRECSASARHQLPGAPLQLLTVLGVGGNVWGKGFQGILDNRGRVGGLLPSYLVASEQVCRLGMEASPRFCLFMEGRAHSLEQGVTERREEVCLGQAEQGRTRGSGRGGLGPRWTLAGLSVALARPCACALPWAGAVLYCAIHLCQNPYE